MKKNEGSGSGSSDRDTMRAEYDFSGAVRGVTAARFAQGANVIVIDPDLLDVFVDGTAVNEGSSSFGAGDSETSQAGAPLTGECSNLTSRHRCRERGSVSTSR